MHPDEQLRKAVRGFYAWIGSLLLAGIGPIGAARLIESPATMWRVAGVVLAVGAWIPMIVVVGMIIRAGDEFARRIHLVALALAFGAALVFVSLLDWLTRAEFMASPPLMIVWVGISILWVVALIVSKRYYERPR